MIHFIYRWKDKRDNSTRYVGITLNPNIRFQQHLAMHDTNEKKNAWIQELLELDMSPEIEIIEVIYKGKEFAYERERYWITYYLEQGEPLTNIVHTRKTTDKPVVKKKVCITPKVKRQPISNPDTFSDYDTSWRDDYYIKFRAIEYSISHKCSREDCYEFDRLAKKLGILPKKWQTNEWYHKDDVRAIKLLAKTYIRREDMDQWIEAHFRYNDNLKKWEIPSSEVD